MSMRTRMLDLPHGAVEQLESSGISGMPCTEPLCAMIWLRISSVHRPRAIRSRSRCWLTTANSPASTRREYRLDVYGSKHSLLPRICAVDAVGIGASSSELRSAVLRDLGAQAAQSHRGRRRDAPHVVLQHALATRASPRTSRSGPRSGELARAAERREVDGLEDVLVERARLVGVEGQPQHAEGVGQALHAQADRPVPQVDCAAPPHRVVVVVDDAVQVARDDCSVMLVTASARSKRRRSASHEARQRDRRRGCTRRSRPATCTRRSRCTGWSSGWCRGSAGWTCGCTRPCRACTACPSRSARRGWRTRAAAP